MGEKIATLIAGILGILAGTHAIRHAIRSLHSGKIEDDEVVMHLTKKRNPVIFEANIVERIVVGTALIFFSAFMVVFGIVRLAGK